MSSSKAVILVVDDTPSNIDILSAILRSEYTVKAATSGEKALALALGSPLDLILLDVMMPGMDGYEVCRRLKGDPRTSSIPVIFVTALSETTSEEEGFAAGGVDYITKPVKAPIVKARVRAHLALHAQQRELERQVRERTMEIAETRLEIIRRLSRAVGYKDDESGLHILRMSRYAYILAKRLGLEATWTETLLQASPMHDVGKIGVPDKILLKPGKLNPEEWEIMKRHTLFGAEIIGEHPSLLLRMARDIALTHHEKWDGSGYPLNLRGEATPLCGRISAIADVFDALTTKRPYKEAWPVEDAVKEILSGSGTQFDPELIARFKDSLPEILEARAEIGEQ